MMYVNQIILSFFWNRKDVIPFEICIICKQIIITGLPYTILKITYINIVVSIIRIALIRYYISSLTYLISCVLAPLESTNNNGFAPQKR